MSELSISKFKATCLAVIEQVRLTGETVTVTRRGEPVAEVHPPKGTSANRERLFGLMAGKGKILGDVVSPAVTADEWDAAKP